MIDQRKLPLEEVYVECRSEEEVARAIETMVIRGAPAIGVAAAFGVALGVMHADPAQEVGRQVGSIIKRLARTRPTARNLFWALERMSRVYADNKLLPRDALGLRLLQEAQAMEAEDLEINKKIGSFGNALIADGDSVLTHCNAGGLATSGYGTAIGVIRTAFEAGKNVRVFVDETRPFLQGARLTAWELVKLGIPMTLITDNMAGWLMKKGEISLVITGADRIVRNGDAANKIGTYSLAVLARHHQVPLYGGASAPSTSACTGEEILIEERPGMRSAESGSAPYPAGCPAQPGLRCRAGQAHQRPRQRARARPSAVPRQPGAVAERRLGPGTSLVGDSAERAMNILAIETSCDETAAAVVTAERRILSSVVLSQDEVHAPYGGVVPELASRQHLRSIGYIVAESLRRAALSTADIDAFAVTQGPGLIGSLLVGLSFAKGLAYYYRKPLLGIDHLEAHMEAAFIESPDIRFPALALLVSGGHTSLFLLRKRLRFRLLGRTRDDAAGEALDKIAKFLELGYPGGPVIERLSAAGDSGAFAFSLPRMKDGSLDFSFSGLKTAALRWIGEKKISARHPQLRDFLASFEAAVVRALLEKVADAVGRFRPVSLVLCGGVARNKRLRTGFDELARESGLSAHIPSPAFCTDNAAMVGALAGEKLRGKKKPPLSLDLDAYPRFSRAAG
jgi:tRNA threonylcarbamoyl adenosine modification protein TsaD/S-methyl-5-thioribose-1-phosphate isomerase